MPKRDPRDGFIYPRLTPMIRVYYLLYTIHLNNKKVYKGYVPRIWGGLSLPLQLYPKVIG